MLFPSFFVGLICCHLSLLARFVFQLARKGMKFCFWWKIILPKKCLFFELKY